MARGKSGLTLRRRKGKGKSRSTGGGISNLGAGLIGGGIGLAAGYGVRSLQDLLSSMGLPTGPTLGPTPPPPASTNKILNTTTFIGPPAPISNVESPPSLGWSPEAGYYNIPGGAMFGGPF